MGFFQAPGAIRADRSGIRMLSCLVEADRILLLDIQTHHNTTFENNVKLSKIQHAQMSD